MLKKVCDCNDSVLPIYSVATGLLFYSIVYVYLLMTNSEYLQFFNKFLIYIVGIDLLSSTFINIKQKKAEFLEDPHEELSESDTEETVSTVTVEDDVEDELQGTDDTDDVDDDAEDAEDVEGELQGTDDDTEDAAE